MAQNDNINSNPNIQNKPDLEHVLTRRRQTLKSFFSGTPLCKTPREFEDLIKSLKVQYSVSESTESALESMLVSVIAPRNLPRASRKHSEEQMAPEPLSELEESLKASEELLEPVPTMVLSSSVITDDLGGYYPPPPAGQTRTYKKKV